MAPRPYTQRFHLFAGGGSTAALDYFVPPGYRAVVMNLDIYKSDIAEDAGAALWIGAYVLASVIPGGTRSLSRTFRAVGYSGERLRVSWWGLTVSGATSGYIFEDSAGPVGHTVTPADEPLELPVVGGWPGPD